MRITCKFFKSIYQKDDFKIAIYLMVDGSERKFITCKGNGLPLTNSCFYHFNGERVVEKNKQVFKVDYFELATSTSKTGVLNFFKHDVFMGIEKNIIKKIVDTFGTDTFDVIETKANKLLKIDGMTLEKLEILKKGYSLTMSLKDITKELAPMGISTRVIKKINESYHDEALEILKTNPFKLIETKGIGFKTCDTIARYNNVALNSKERIEGGVVYTLSELCGSDTYVLDDVLIEKTVIKLNDGLDESIIKRNDVIKAIASLIKEHKIFVEDNHKMILDEYYYAEENISKKINEILKLDVFSKDTLLNEVEAVAKRYSLSNGQISAVKKSLSSKISIITGGSGTGKTTVLRSIINAYQNVMPNAQITLLSPTGKASRRMSEVIGLNAFTIHKRLGLFEGNETPLSIPSGLVVVDEFSMVDTLLFAKLMEAVGKLTQIVLVGDINQLPSVGAGACLKDLIESEILPVSHLTEIFRQEDGIIIDNSLKVINKNPNLLYDKATMMKINVKGEDEAIEQIKKIYSFYAKKEGIENVALISPLRATQQGRFKCVADELNIIMQEELNNFGFEEIKYGTHIFKENDRVMMWKNTEIASNGDVGVIEKISKEEDSYEIKICWENGNTGTYHKQDLENITLAYSMSVHKSQGSEYDTVIIPVLKEHICSLFKNNMLYTAITRGKKRVILISDENDTAINYMVSHSDTYKRKTLLKEKLITFKSHG